MVSIRGDIKFYGERYFTDKSGKAQIIKSSGLNLTDNFLRNLCIRKSDEEFVCAVTNKECPKGTRYLGDKYDKVSMFTFGDWFDNSIKTLEGLIKTLKERKKVWEEFKDKWEAEAVVGVL